MRCRTFLALLLLPLALPGTPPLPAHAQTRTAAAPATLQQALERLSPAGVALAVGAENRKPVPAGPASGGHGTLAQAVRPFGMAVRRFGGVDAIAPAVMIRINPLPGQADPFQGMPEHDVVPLLLSTLTDAQWAELTGERGLALGTLDPRQQALFSQLLPQGRLRVEPWRDAYHPNPEDQERDLTAELPVARLRLTQTATVDVSIKGGDRSYHQIEIPPAPAGMPAYSRIHLMQNAMGHSDVVGGQRVRTVAPNTPKPGQLDFALPALQAAIPLNDLKTVGDLIARIGTATRLEIYADRRLERKSLQRVGTRTAAPAADLLQALAFCLTGAYRRVGPAYVLTDDIAGIATRQAIWQEHERDADALRQKSLVEARNRLEQRFGAQKLPAFGDPLGGLDERKALGAESERLATLPPEPRQAILAAIEKWNQAVEARRIGAQPLDPEGFVRLFPALSLQVLVPSLDAPIAMGQNLPRLSVFEAPAEIRQARRQAEEEKSLRALLEQNAPALAKAIQQRPEFWDSLSQGNPRLAAEILARYPEVAAAVNAPRPPHTASDLRKALEVIPNRAALVSPTTREEAAAEVAAAQEIGLTQLWVRAFSEGKANVEPLDEALTRARGTSLQVYAALDLFSWGQAAPETARDLTVLGETIQQADKRRQNRRAFEGDGYYEDDPVEIPSGVVVNPRAPEVRKTILGLLGRLKAMEGLAGIVLREAAPPGYDMRPFDTYRIGTLLLGYQEDMRLAFLRAHHADPLDVFSPSNPVSTANTDLPAFAGAAGISRDLNHEWLAFRGASNLDFLREIHAAVKPLRVLVKQRGMPRGGMDASGKRARNPGWYGSWDDPLLPPPTLYDFRDDEEKQPLAKMEMMEQARAQSSLVLPVLPLDARAGWPRNLPSLAGYWKQSAIPGIVLDPGARPLDRTIKTQNAPR